jgi:hypothetical protein
MALPPFLILPTEADYRTHFQDTYVRGLIQTRDGVRVHFNASNFEHAFFESTKRDGNKDQFSEPRAQRMDWISHTLSDPNADWYQGWMARKKSYDATRCATVASGDFVVVLNFRAMQTGDVVSNFVTCYHADNSIGKIRTSPAWDLAKCRTALGV